MSQFSFHLSGKVAAAEPDVYARLVESDSTLPHKPPEGDALVMVRWLCARTHGKTVLEVGSSHAYTTVALAIGGSCVFSINAAPAAAREASRLISQQRHHVKGRVICLHGCFTNFNTSETEVDVIVVHEFPEERADWNSTIAKAAEILKRTGGILVQIAAIGITESIDRSRAQYFTDPYHALCRYFEEVDFDAVGTRIGFVARKPRQVSVEGQPSKLKEIDVLESTFYSLESYLRKQISSVSSKLNDANAKYRALGESHCTLKAKLEDAAQREKAASLQLIDAKNALQRANEETRALEVALHNQRRTETEVTQRLQAELEAMAKGCRDASSQVSEFEKTVKWLEEIRSVSQRLVGTLEAELKERSESLIRLQREYEQMSARLEVSTHERDVLADELEATRAEIEVLRSDHELTIARLMSEQALRAELSAKVDQANEKYRQVTSNQIPLLKQKLEEQTGHIRELQRRTEHLNEELGRVKEQERNALRTLGLIRSSVTYRAGLYLRAASGSLVDAIKLPLRLWRLRRQVQSSAVSPRTVPAADGNEGIDAEAPHAVAGGVLPSIPFEPDLAPLATKPLRQIRVACIMDEFTFGSYRPECDLTQLTPGRWEVELTDCRPELLFIESAWRGKDELWGSKVGHASQELQGIVRWCCERHIPTLFWNKEDPVHFETFLNTARLFDYVFTTDIDCIHRYKTALGHERVYLLPFACQPAVHNPIEKYSRKDAFCFAGAYYARYPERTRDLESFVRELPEFRPLEIYDRNFGKTDPNYQFPATYQPHIVGTLPFEDIDKAYKGYRYAINLNSIKQSQTMFARRVYELLGSNTLTISNFSRGVRLMFGDLVVTSDSGAEVRRRLEALQAAGRTDKLRVAGVRKAMLEHTYGERLSYALSKITGRDRRQTLPKFAVFGTATSTEDVCRLVAHVERQHTVEATLSIVLSAGLASDQAEAVLTESSARVTLLPDAVLKEIGIKELAEDANWLATMLPCDYYGPNYLLDIALATRYSDAQVIGKAAHHRWHDDGCELVVPDASYRPAERLVARRSAIALAAAETICAEEWLTHIDSWCYEHPAQLAIDPYSYCADVSADGSIEYVAEIVDDSVVDTGIDLSELIKLAEDIAPPVDRSANATFLSGRQLAYLMTGKPLSSLVGPGVDPGENDMSIALTRNSAIETRIEGETLVIGSELPDGKHEYLYATKTVDCSEIAEQLGDTAPGILPLHLEVEPGLNLSLVILFFDAERRRIGHVVEQPNCNQTIHMPAETTHIRFGLRIYAGGSARIKRLLFGHLDLDPPNILGQSDVLLLTNHYPSYDDLYRNAFVHSRVRGYQEHGVNVDVFRLRRNQPLAWHEFQNVDVTTGSQDALRRILASGRYRHVLVHFLDQEMWDVLKDFIDDIRVTVWIHGAEVQPWWRREYNYQTPGALAEAKLVSDARMYFWKRIFAEFRDNLRFVFVSSYFAREVMEDVGVELPEAVYHIIHNPIDTDLFSYRVKPAKQRAKILSIRPYASRKYANDLSVEAVLQLSKEPFFHELEFRFIGDGELFDETTGPLRGFPNVSVERRFLDQNEISALHKEYGVFLSPTRMDAQGVSRDEAMASGLVPVTNSVAAIPEFVDDSCAILAPPEGTKEMAEGIRKLYFDPDLFLRMSFNAAKRAREQVAKKNVLALELALFRPGNPDQC